MIDHLGIAVSSLARSTAFYTDVLATLGFGIVKQSDRSVGFGVGKKPEFSIFLPDNESLHLVASHIAFAASDRPSVDAFYAAALAAGGVCNGAPGLRPEYHANYYGAFVTDADGNNVEAVCHTSP